jgi:protein disulfide-isomerase A1
MLFAYADAVGGIQERLAEFMGVTAADLPTLRAVLPADMKKFECDTAVAALTIEVIGKFADDILSGALKPHLKSDPIPEDNAGPVTTVVGLNFAETVLDSTKDVLVKYYAPWCGHCKKLAPIWEELGELYKDNKDIVIAKFDSTTNEAEGVEVKGYPTLIFYPKGNKAGVTFEGDRTLEGLTKYLEEQIPSLVSASGAGGAAAEGEL